MIGEWGLMRPKKGVEPSCSDPQYAVFSDALIWANSSALLWTVKPFVWWKCQWLMAHADSAHHHADSLFHRYLPPSSKNITGFLAEKWNARHSFFPSYTDSLAATGNCPVVRLILLRWFGSDCNGEHLRQNLGTWFFFLAFGLFFTRFQQQALGNESSLQASNQTLQYIYGDVPLQICARLLFRGTGALHVFSMVLIFSHRQVKSGDQYMSAYGIRLQSLLMSRPAEICQTLI